MTVSTEQLAEQFSAHRTHLIGVAYRLTSTLSDAEDTVQDAWLRLAALDPGKRAEIRDLKAWLTTVVGRLCLDRLRSAPAQRERYVGPWLPEPVITPYGGAPGGDPLETVVRDDGVRMAALVLLDRLTPEQRVAFVLHDAFGLPFDEIAGTLGCSSAAARQHASRARRAVADADPPPRSSISEQRAMLERFLDALVRGDVAAMVELLHPDAVLIGDANGKARTARRQVVGADKISRFLVGVMQQYRAGTLQSGELVMVNGELGMYLPAGPGDEQHKPVDEHLQTFALRDGKIAAIYDVANPDKLKHVAGRPTG